MYPPSSPQRLVKQAGQGPASVAFEAGCAEGAAELTQDLPLPYHHGVQPGGYPEEMPGAIFSLHMVKMLPQVGPGYSR